MKRVLLSLILIFAVVADAPSIIEARSGPDGAIFLKWNGSGDLFILYRGEESNFETAEEIGRTNGLLYTDYPGVNGHTYYYWATALSEGSESPPSPPAYALCDSEAPICIITSPLNGAQITGALTLQGTAADGETGVSQVEVSINGKWYTATGTSSWQFSLSSPPEGEVTISCRCQDRAGNISDPAVITVVVESISPEIISITPDTVEYNTPATVQIAGRNFVKTPQVLLGTQSCSVQYVSDSLLTILVPHLNPGVYDVTVINPGGKSDTFDQGFTVREPNSPPEIIQITAQPQFVPNNGTTTVLLTARVEDAEDNLYSVTIDLSAIGGGITSMKDDGIHPDRTKGDHIYSTETTVTKATPEGKYSLTVTATDEHGAKDTGSVIVNVVEDPPDNPPELLNNQVTPSSGTSTTIFRYSVTYRDQDNNVPTYVSITITGVGTFNMVELDPSDYNYMDGKNYYYEYSGLGTGIHSYTISASDGTNPVSIGATGPTVSGTNTPPDLLSPQVTPSSGSQTTNFRYKVTYTDADNDDPVSVTITITGVGTFNMVELDPSDQYFKDGKVYYYDYTAGLSVGTHSYTITADDGTDTTSVGGTGPTVTADSNTPCVLSSYSVTPTCGNTSTVFIYQVTYTDANNDDPISITITITGVGTFNMSELDPEDQYFTNGKVYYYVYAGGLPIGTHSYTITAHDGTDTTSVGGTDPEIPVGDCAPPPPPPNPLINIYPIAGPSGVLVTVSGTGFAALEDNITVTFSGVPVALTPLGSTPPGTSLGTVKASSTGTFSAKFKVPPSSPGHKPVDAYGDVTPASSVPNRTFNVISIPLPPYFPPPSAQPPSDTISPNSTITYPRSNDKLKGTTVLVKGSASDNNKVVKVEVSFDNGVTWHVASGTETWSYRWRLPSDGIYTIRSRATDDEGNVEMVGGRVTIIIDNTPPMVTITTEFKEIENENDFTITGIAEDNDMVRKIEISTDSGNTWILVEGTAEWTYPWTPSDGMYTLQARAWDDLGHLGYSDVITLIVDTTPPELYINTPDRTEVSGDSFLISGTAYDVNGIDFVEVAIGEESYQKAQGTDSWTYLWILPEQPGEYLIYIRAWDKAGLTSFQEITLIVVQGGGRVFGLSTMQLIIIAGAVVAVVVAAVLLILYFRS
ncbi:MAG: IPT/TIG domain-containing protein [Theionarchaea archaeon]|nr:IPT/TIG domain-containing protein [Theionarchaea archaeon]